MPLWSRARTPLQQSLVHQMHQWVPMPAPWEGLGVHDRRWLVFVRPQWIRGNLPALSHSDSQLSVVQGSVRKDLQYVWRNGPDVS